jgi:polysaccharide biosynthesis protein PslH
MKRILFISTRIPFPIRQGDRLICYQRLQDLSKKYSITLMTFYQSPKELESISEIAGFCEEIHAIYLPKWKSVLNCLVCFFTPSMPFQVAYYKSKKFQLKLDQITSACNFDLAHYFLARVANYQVPIQTPKIIELVDSMQLNFSSRIAIEQNKFTKLILENELPRIANYETNVIDQFKKSILVSQIDADLITKDIDKIAIVPCVVNTDIFTPLATQKDNQTIKLVFSGRMGYSPNICAAIWFAKKCFTAINQACPKTKFVIVGADATKTIVNLGKTKNIEVTGYVESMAEMLAQSDIAVMPMQSGSGMQYKILEAMACGLPVVTTTLGLGMIQAIDGESVLIADTIESFIAAVISLIQDRDKRRKIGQNSREFVVKHHSLLHAEAQIESIYQSVIGNNLGTSGIGAKWDTF